MNTFARQAMGRCGAAFAVAGGVVWSEEEKEKRLRVLVTGFHDWRDLERNVWRCRDNPSCRLIYDRVCHEPSARRDGALVRALRAAPTKADFTFVTMPTVWGVAGGLDLLAYDVVVHMGLGVYDRRDVLLLERGAMNSRRGADALGSEPTRDAEIIDPETESARLLLEPMASNATRLAGERFGKFTLEVADARAENRFICNETHYKALRARDLARDDDPNAHLRAAYFIHLPYPEKNAQVPWKPENDDHTDLANGVAALVRRLVDLHADA